MTGRQYTRTGVPGVFGPTVGTGLPLTEITVAEQLKTAGYRTAIQGELPSASFGRPSWLVFWLLAFAATLACSLN